MDRPNGRPTVISEPMRPSEEPGPDDTVIHRGLPADSDAAGPATGPADRPAGGLPLTEQPSTVPRPEPTRIRRATPVATRSPQPTRTPPAQTRLAETPPAQTRPAETPPAQTATRVPRTRSTHEAPALEPPPLAPPIRPAVTAGDVAGLLLISLGAFVAPILAPVLGLLLLWRSRGWRRTDKGAVTALVALPIIAALGVVAVSWFLTIWRF